MGVIWCTGYPCRCGSHNLGENKYVLERQSSGRAENSSLFSKDHLNGNRFLIMCNKGQLARESNATFSIFILRLSLQSMTLISYSCQQWLFLLSWFYPWKLLIVPKKEGVAMVLSSAEVSLYTNDAQQLASQSLIVWKYSHAVTFSANFLLLCHKAGQTEDWACEWCQPRLWPGLPQLPPHLIKRFWTCLCILRPSC